MVVLSFTSRNYISGAEYDGTLIPFRPVAPGRHFTPVFLGLVFLAGLTYTAFRMTPSSYGHTLEAIGAPEAGPVLGVARPIRSDEWAVLTPQVQAAVRNRFRRFNETSFYREDLRNFFMPPLRDRGLVFRPQCWLFFIASPATAWSAYWAFFMCLFIAGYYSLFLELGIAPMAACAASLALFFSGFSQFWWTTNALVMVGLPWVVWVIFRPWRPIPKALFLTWTLVAWVMAMPYVPLLLDTAWAIPVIVLAFRPRLVVSGRELAIAGVAALAASAILYGYYADVAPIMRNTVYPGRRIAPPGGVPLTIWASQLFPFLTFNLRTYDSFQWNICEAGAAGSWLPLLTMSLLKYSKLRDGRYREIRRALWILGAAFALITIWQIAPAPLWLGRILLWDRTNPQRLLFLSGLLLTIASLTLLKSELVEFSWQRIALFVLIGPATAAALKHFLFRGTPTGYGLDLGIAAMAAAVCLSLGALPLRARMPLLMALVAGINVYGFGRFNPLQSAVPIFEIPETPVMTALRQKAAAAPGGYLTEPGFQGATLNGLGFRSVGHTLVSPQLATFRRYFPGMEAAEFNAVFNRYANIQISRYPVPYVDHADSIQVAAEAFEPGAFYYSPANIDARTVRMTLPGGMKLVMLPKKTPGKKVAVRLDLHYGNESNLLGRSAAAAAAGALLMSGTRAHTGQQIRDELARLNAQMNVGVSVAAANLSVDTVRASLPDALRLATEVLREPAFSRPEFERVRLALLERATLLQRDPRFLLLKALYLHTESYPEGDPRGFAASDGGIDDYIRLTLADVRQFHADFFGASNGELAVVGDFDPAEVQKLATDLLGSWKSPAPYAGPRREWRRAEAVNQTVESPNSDKAFFAAATSPNLSETDSEYPALLLINAIIGEKVRSRTETEKLNCELRSEVLVHPVDESVRFVVLGRCDPQSISQAESVFRQEMSKLLKNGVSAEEAESARNAFVEQWEADRLKDESLARLLNIDARLGSTRVREDDRRRTTVALSAKEITDVARRVLDLSSFFYFRAGQF